MKLSLAFARSRDIFFFRSNDVVCPSLSFALTFSLLSASVVSGGGGLRYDLQEESPVGTTVGNVRRDSNLTQRLSVADAGRLRFALRPTTAMQGGRMHDQAPMFAVDEKTGVVGVARVLDRESLCPYTAAAAAAATCDLPFEVSVRPVEFYRVIKAVVRLVDVNDNRPTFPTESVALNVPETALPGAAFVVPSAEDPDSGLFGVQEYRLLSADPDVVLPFQLVVTEQFPGVVRDVRLKLMRRIDREETDGYRVTVVALDGGVPQKSGSMVVHVVVLDSNDNAPQFENSTYEVEIREDLAPDSTLVTVRATDPDRGRNGEVRYSLADQTEAAYGETFGVDETQGTVFLRRPVDYERHRSFVVTVRATDMGPGALSVFAKVTVNVADVNDNPPAIAVNVLTDSGVARVQENTDPGTFVAHVAVTDPDSGSNGEVQCFVDNRAFFSLDPLQGSSSSSSSSSEYILATVAPLDREDRPDFDLVVTCRDRGDDGSLTSSATVRVEVADENDNRPELGLPSNPFEVKIREGITSSSSSSAAVFKVNATDRDLGPNGDLVYRLRPLKDVPKDEFSIDPSTGNVYALRSLDYERRTVYRFLLNVSDRGVEPLSATATVVISVLDVNDEPPRFERTLYFLTVRENQPPGTLAGRVNATDDDLSPDFRRVTYAFVGASPPGVGVFDLDERTGELTVLRRLDREEQDTYRLTVAASNLGFPGMASLTNVTVSVEDENDNAPVFLFPGGGAGAGAGGGGADTVEVAAIPAHSTPTGTIVARLSAVDRDLGRNAELVYEINSGNVDDLFRVDPTTGVVTLARRPRPSSHPDRHRLVVVARDLGVPQRFGVADLTVVFNNSLGGTAGVVVPDPESAAGPPGEAPLLEGGSVVVLVGAVLGFVVVVVLTVVVTVVCIRRRRRLAKTSRRSRCDDPNEVSHRHYRSPSFGGRRLGSLASSSSSSAAAGEYGDRAVSPSNRRRRLPGCECEAMIGDSSFVDVIPADWTTDLQHPDSGIVESSDGLPVSFDSAEGAQPARHPTPSLSSSSSSSHGVSRTRSFSPHLLHHLPHHRHCSHGSRCPGGGGGGGVPFSPRCRPHQSPSSFRKRSTIAVGAHSVSEAVTMLQPSTMVPNGTQADRRCRDHDLESLESASTWNDSGRGPSEEEERVRSGQGQGRTPCLKCGAQDDAVSVTCLER